MSLFADPKEEIAHYRLVKNQFKSKLQSLLAGIEHRIEDRELGMKALVAAGGRQFDSIINILDEEIRHLKQLRSIITSTP